MADLSFLQEQEDSQEELDGLSDQYGDGDGDLLDFGSQEESLSPLARLDKYLHSDNVFNRQMVARSMVDTLRAVCGVEAEVCAVVERVSGLAQDAEPSVRVELMEQLPQLVMFCHDSLPQLLPSALNNHLLPALLSHLADPNNQVRKTAQAALLVLLEQEVMTSCDLEKWVCPVLVELSAPDSNDDVKTEAMAMMCKMAPLVGREVTERLFLPRFCELCCDCRMFHVRKVCAANFGDMCRVVGGRATEELLLPRFFQLCGDNVWGVRKACAECFMTVSAASTTDVRRTKLASLFINLITDPSRWVRQAAFQSLGQFISTFASSSSSSSSSTGLETSSEEKTVTKETTTPTAQDEDSVSHNPPLSCDSSRAPMGRGEEERQVADLTLTTTDTLHSETPHTHAPVHDQTTRIHTSAEREGTQHTPGGAHTHTPGDAHTHTGIEETGGTQGENNAITASFSTLHSSFTSSSSPVSSPPLSSPVSSSATLQSSFTSSPISLPPLSSSSLHSSVASSSPVTSSSPVSSSPSIPEADMFNSFHFWRTPLPVIDLDQELLKGESSAPGPSFSPSRLVDSAAPASRLQCHGPAHHTSNQTASNQTDSNQTSNQMASNQTSNQGSPPTDPVPQQIPPQTVLVPLPPATLSPASLPPAPQAQTPEPAQIHGDNWECIVSSTPVPGQSSSSGTHVALGPTLGRKQLEELIENLEPHIDDPDVKAQVDVLTAALQATVLGEGPEEEEAESEQRSSQGYRESQRSLRSPSYKENAFCLGVESDMSDELFNPEEERRSKQQDVVPQALLDQYLSMTEPSRAQTVDMEIAKHCAYSLPGVARTLGRHNWHCLRDTYETLASDMQWKVRRTLAFSIHELALILGEELTCEDLLPVFNSFLKDLDEVRIGVLKHLYDFLRLLGVDTRRKYLYQFQEFLVTDNSRNWRFRSDLSEQLVLLMQLYSGQEVFDFLRPLAFYLCTDRVSSVRWSSYKLVSEMMRKLACCQALLADFLSQLVNKFCLANKWLHRQTFTTICQLAVEEECLSLDQFSEFLLLPLLRLAGDPVPNVRILLAKTLQHTLLEREYFISGGCVHKGALQDALSSLQADLDRDVQYYATHSLTHSHTLLHDDDTSATY